ncbi:sperm-associated antigen 5 [Neopsephotus bourkii]|uniref:sperm-associated antigen 5 n=1 Tax=Neopsephotus bourkii TaxID=309878 RepID=UPI002AA53652|nr:sperm-associated antigen 5 [Neopsephotus bourkii]
MGRDHDCATPVPCTRGPRSSVTPVPCALGPPRSAVLPPPRSNALLPCTPGPPSSTIPEAPGTPTLGPSVLEPPRTPTLVPSAPEPPNCPSPELPGSSTPEPPSNTVEAPLDSPIPWPSNLELPSSPPPDPCILEPPSSPTPAQLSIISSVPCTPNSPDSTTIAPCTPGPSGNTSSDSCTPGPPGTTSTPQEGSFHGWQVAPSDFSCSPLAPEPPSGDEGAGSLPCQDTPEEAKSPSPAPQEQGSPASSPIEAGRSEPAALEGRETPIPSPEVALGAVSWVLPLVWLEKTLNSSSLMESLRHSLTLPRRDIGTNVTPVPIAVTGTSITPAPIATTGTNITPAPIATTGTNVTPVPIAVTGTSITPAPIATTGTSVTPVPAATTGTSVTPVPTATIGTSVTPVPTAITGTNVTPVPIATTGTSVTPVPAATTGTSVTPVPTTVTGTFMTPRDLRESSTNTSTGPPPCAKDSAAETDSLLWHCPREQLKSLPRAELEGRLESTLIIIEALSLQLRGWTETQRSLPGVGPAEQRDAFTQTDVTHPKGEEEIYRTLYLELRRRTDALQRQRGAEQDLHRELKTAVEAMETWSRQRLLFQGLVDASFQSLQDEQRALTQKWEQARALVSRCQALLERVPSKLQSCLEERDAMRQRADEALQAKQEASRQLEETSAALQDTAAKLDQLTVANSRLSADHSSLVTSMASLEQERDARQRERDALQQENEKQREEMAWLAREREVLQRERDGLCQELQEATECREFLEQEKQMSRTQLLEVEARLRSVLDTLQERSQQHEELMDSHQRLREERAALSKELESTKAELLDLQLKRNKVSWCSKDIVESKMRLQELAECLRAALQEEDDGGAAPSKSRAWTPVPRTPGWQTPYRVRTPASRTPMFRTPHRAIGSSFVGSVLKAVCGEDADEAAGVGSALTKDKPAATPKAIEPEDGLLESVKQLRSVVSDLTMLSCRIQDLEQSEFKALQTEISNLQLHLETVTTESQEKIDAQAATIVKLNKALRGKLESEKELQDVVKQQEEKMLQLIDKSGEVTSLKEEVFHLKRSLQRAETEAKVLWEEMREQRPKEDAVHVQERVLQQQEIGKLRLLLLEKVEENQRLSDKFQGLELQLHRIQKVLRRHEEMQEKMKEVLVPVPDVAVACQEHPSLLRYLGLKPESVSKEAAEPL